MIYQFSPFVVPCDLLLFLILFELVEQISFHCKMKHILTSKRRDLQYFSTSIFTYFLQSNVFFLTCVKFVFAKHVVPKAKTYFYVYIF